MKRQEKSNLEKARIAWGDDLPDYIVVLAERCDETTQRAVGRALGFHASAVSKLINRNYEAGYDELEIKIRRVLMNVGVACPTFGEIPLASCLNIRRAKPEQLDMAERNFASACARCPLNSDIKKKVTSHATA